MLLSADDLGAAVDAAVEARLENTGQACNAAKRFIVAEGIYDDFVAGFTERMLAGSDELSPRCPRSPPPRPWRSRSIGGRRGHRPGEHGDTAPRLLPPGC